MKIEVSSTGKHIITYKSKGNKHYSPKEVGQYLKKFQLCQSLRFIGKLAIAPLDQT